jgi:hypothetical protein
VSVTVIGPVVEPRNTLPGCAVLIAVSRNCASVPSTIVPLPDLSGYLIENGLG